MKLTYALVAMVGLLAGCGKGRAGTLSTNFAGTWDLTYDDAIEVTVRTGEREMEIQIGGEGGRVAMADGGVDFAIDCSREDVTCPSEVWPRELKLDDESRGLDVQGVQLVRWLHGRGKERCKLRPGSIITAEIMSVATAHAIRPEAVALTGGRISTVLSGDCIAPLGGLADGAEVTLTTGFSAAKR